MVSRNVVGMAGVAEVGRRRRCRTKRICRAASHALRITNYELAADRLADWEPLARLTRKALQLLATFRNQRFSTKSALMRTYRKGCFGWPNPAATFDRDRAKVF